MNSDQQTQQSSTTSQYTSNYMLDQTENQQYKYIKLKKCNEIILRMLSTQKNVFTFILFDQKHIVPLIRYFIEDQKNIILYFDDIHKFNSHYNNLYKSNANHTLIVPPSYIIDIKQVLKNKSEIKNVLVCNFKNYKNFNQAYQINGITSFVCKKTFVNICSVYELFTAIKAIRQTLQFKILPTFLKLSTKREIESKQWSIYSDLLKREISPKFRQKIVQKLRNLFIYLIEKSPQFKNSEISINEFVEQLKKGPMDTYRAIHWYTNQCPIYKLINNLLRYSVEDSQILYIQPFFKDLVNAITQLYKKQKKNNQFNQFVCYRGAEMSGKQLYEIKKCQNQYVESLGFLSCSLNLNTALGFTKDVLFHIKVNKKEQYCDCSQGYACIKAWSNFFGEEEILFNPFNIFKVEKVKPFKKDQRQIHFIQLVYVQKNAKQIILKLKQQQLRK